MSNIALITGVTGQDGSFLAELLLEKGYEVHGIIRRSSSFNTSRIDHIYHDKHIDGNLFTLHYGDLSDSTSLRSLIQEIKPDEVYNLAAQSHVQVSFLQPEYTADVTGLGTLRLLDAVREFQNLNGKEVKFYQASSSEMFGQVKEIPQTEKTPFYPRSPYACAKVYSFWQTVNYRESYGMHCSNGILFNHESERRGETFVTRKITRAMTKIVLGMQEKLYLGNIDASRDWGYAKDYVEAMWLMLQQDEGDDYVVATNKTYSVRQFIVEVCSNLGVEIEWQGNGLDEKGIVKKVEDNSSSLKKGQVIIEIDERYFRPAEVEYLHGSYDKAKEKLGWSPETDLNKLAKIMTDHDLKLAKKERLFDEE